VTPPTLLLHAVLRPYAVVDGYLLPAGHSAANPSHAANVTDRRMDAINRGPHSLQAVLIVMAVCGSLRPWDSMNDVVQYEHNMVIQTKTRHQTPIVHATSVLHVDDLPRGHRRTRSRCIGSTSLHRVHRDNGASSSSDCPEMFSAHDLDFSGNVSSFTTMQRNSVN